MAQKKTNKKTGNAAKTSTRAAKSTRSPAPPAEPHPPRRREILALLFFLSAIYLLIGYFRQEGAIIVFGTDLIKSLIGYGFWLTAPALLFCAVILAFHHGRPVAFRSFCILMLPMLFAAMVHVLRITELAEPFDFKAVSLQLMQDGRLLASGGLLGGLFAIALFKAVGKIGAFISMLLIFALFLIIGTKFDVSGAAGKIKERATRPYEPEEEPLGETNLRSEDKPSRRREKTRQESPESMLRSAARPKKTIDIPLGADEEELPLRKFEESQPEPEPKKARVRKKTPPEVQTVSPTERVEPMDPDEAANLAGIALAREPQPAPARVRPVVTTEISDPPKTKKPPKIDVEAEAQAVEAAISESEEAADYQFPPLSLLKGGSGISGDYRDEVRLNRERLENALHSFGISSAIVGMIRGPTVTRYDIELEQGVKLSRVTNLAGDLALALGVVNVRIAPIPDKISTVGIEVPNKLVSTVYLRDILDTPKFANAKSKISFALGKDISGEGIIGNIAKLPHLLIAGTTGSGKSVCMNSLILSLLYKARPDEVRLIMIDPKMVELGIYNGIPHLYVPVVTDPKKAAGALQWATVEMLKRYRLFSEANVRDIESYNRVCTEKGEAILPQVVIVIDELADLMMVAAKEVEESICRVAQMGRAAGMHLVIATQRPSADVITGLMKANVPSRIAFAVSSAMESRIILDQAGAEKLVGMGDMLYSPLGVGKPVRIQGAFVSDEEREAVVQFIKENAEAGETNSEIEKYMTAAETSGAADSGKSAAEESPAGDYDEMLPQAVEAVLEAKSCSVSMLQRRVKLGYSRAARIVDQMEELGIVGPYEGAKPRSVTIDRAGWQELMAQLGISGGAGSVPIPEPDDEDNMEY